MHRLVRDAHVVSIVARRRARCARARRRILPHADSRRMETPLQAASSEGCEGGGFSIVLPGGAIVEADGDTTVPAASLGTSFLVKGKYVEFTVVASTFGIRELPVHRRAESRSTSPAACGRSSTPARRRITAALTLTRLSECRAQRDRHRHRPQRSRVEHEDSGEGLRQRRALPDGAGTRRRHRHRHHARRSPRRPGRPARSSRRSISTTRTSARAKATSCRTRTRRSS